MKLVYSAIAPAVLLVFLTAALRADDTIRVVNPDRILAKVRVAIGEEFTIDLKQGADRALQPSISKRTAAERAAVHVKLAATSSSPSPSPRPGATRPFLSVENHYETPLCFRVLVRLKGSKEFFELSDEKESLPAGEVFTKCWEFDSRVAEVVLFDFQGLK